MSFESLERIDGCWNAIRYGRVEMKFMTKLSDLKTEAAIDRIAVHRTLEQKKKTCNPTDDQRRQL